MASLFCVKCSQVIGGSNRFFQCNYGALVHKQCVYRPSEYASKRIDDGEVPFQCLRCVSVGSTSAVKRSAEQAATDSESIAPKKARAAVAVEAVAGESAASEAAPAEAVPAEAVAGESAASEAAPAEAVPAEAAHAQTTSAEAATSLPCPNDFNLYNIRNKARLDLISEDPALVPYLMGGFQRIVESLGYIRFKDDLAALTAIDVMSDFVNSYGVVDMVLQSAPIDNV